MSKRESRKEGCKSQIINATLAAISESGLSRVNVRQISDKAGVSFGNVHYHYGGKNGLLLQALRQLLTEIKELARQKSSASNSDLANLQAYINAQFAPEFFTSANCTAWLNFWNEASTQSDFSRLENINRSRNLSNLRYCLRPLVGKQRAVSIALDIHIYTNGLWMQKALIKKKLTTEQALDCVKRHLDRVITVTAN